ncbi:hypothetical protein [Paenibacillus sp. CF384]|uniref:hypothetical protein n=1 Tax=Paenibacillus sp. CF384 TaxID=1884382 RepID=UPI000B88DC57|nr:hypothetical protein [Paenibacillus sp. CF384]
MMRINAGACTVVLNDRGEVTSLTSAASSKTYTNTSYAAPLLRISINGQVERPVSAQYGDATAIFHFGDSGVKAEVEVVNKESYVTFELKQLSGDGVDAVIWGPFLTSLSESIGESVGVVHDGEFAIGIQALNWKTIGGWPVELENLAFANQPYEDSKFEYDKSTAWPISEGSLLQAYTRDRTKPARRPAWNLKEVEVPALTGEDAQICGSKIALFGCAASEVLETIEAIELGEGLPHPMIDGVWGKKSPAATQSYLITDFSESSIEQAVEYTKQAGLNYVYHPDPFTQWGHFVLKPGSFPNGDMGMRACVELAADEGVKVGVHTLSNFTTLNDSYVTPIPDQRLQTVGVARLVEPIDASMIELTVDDPEPFRVSLFRQTVSMGSELIEYEAVSSAAPWKLLGVKRGANGTSAIAHESGSVISRLWDHPYDVVFPNIELQEEYSLRIAELFQKTGLRQISFDGLEGCYATGHDDYGVNRFVKRIYDGWNEEVINDASIVVPNYLWHVFTRFNWGEPWGVSTREGQLEWRLSNQRYFVRNFIPSMLGWFLVRSASDRFEATSPDEIEWVLSKAAGFNAGFALSADQAVLKRNGNIDVLLDTVKQWETARHAGAFTPAQQERMRDPKSDWHLEPLEDGSWELYPVHISNPLVCSTEELQPGQPGGSDWAFYNKFSEQPLRLCLRVTPSYGNVDASVKRPTFYTGGEYMTFDTEVHANQYLVCDGDRTGNIYDMNWNLIRTVEASADAPIVRKGGQTVSFSCKFEGDPKPVVSVKVITWGEPESVRRGATR